MKPGFAAALTAALSVGVAWAAPTVAPSTTVNPVDVAGLKREIAAHKGRVLVVNFWATWCGPCKEEFPDLVRLHNTYRTKGLDLVTVAFDDSKDIAGKVKPFLAQNRLATGTFINKSGTDFDDGYLRFLEPNLPPDEAFSLPRTYVFDRTGKLVKTLIGGQTYASFEKTVAPLITVKK